MAIVAYPLNDTPYEAQDARWYNANRTSGVFQLSNCFELEITGEWAVGISSGVAWMTPNPFPFGGFAVASGEYEAFEISPAQGARVDLVVLNYNKASNKASLSVRQGVDGGGYPSYSQTADNFDLVLYALEIPQGASAISSDMIKDLRSNPEYCGLMTDGAQINSIPRHATSHEIGGDDRITPEGIGAAVKFEFEAKILGDEYEWTGSVRPFSQEITVAGIKESDKPNIDIMLTGIWLDDAAIIDSWGHIYRIDTAENKIIVYSDTKTNLADIPIQIIGVR